METMEIIKLVMKELKERKEKYGVDPVRITGADMIVSAGDMVSGMQFLFRTERKLQYHCG